MTVATLTTVSPATATEPKRMTMTLQSSGKVFFEMAGIGTATIDWGDGKAIETHTLSAFDKEDWNNDWREKKPKYRFSHAYPKRHAVRTIIITGENISHLECGSLGLTSLDVSKNNALTDLWCYDNQLTSLDVSKNAELVNLNCSENKLTSLDVNENILLTCLSCSDNQLTNLDISRNTKLTDLHCSSNQLNYLNISNNSALTNLFCSENRLRNLDIGKNLALINLYCSENQLMNLDVSNNTTLKWLLCFDNQLTDLDVSKNIALRGLYCYENQLISLYMSNNIELISLDCCTNQLSATMLDALFETLHNNSIYGKAVINIGYNPGIDACTPNIATDNGWAVMSSTWVKVPVEKEFTPITNTEDEEEDNFVTLDKIPLFKGKHAEIGFRRYTSIQINYPQIAQKNGIEGRVMMEFTVNRQGEVEKVKARKGAHPLLRAEALRVINSSPKWTPGMMRGKPVRAKFQFHLVFSLKR